MKNLINSILKNNYIETKKALKTIDNINQPLEVEESDNIFFFAIKHKADIDILKLLIENGLDLDYTDENGVGIFDEAIRYNDLSLIKLLVEEKGINPLITKRKSGFTPLMQAVSYGYIEIVKYLLDKGADMDEKDNFGFCAKDYARKLGQVKVLEFLNNYQKPPK